MEKSFILSLVFAGIIGLFALKNGEKVEIDLFFKQVEISQAIIIFISAFLGAIIVAFLGLVKDIKMKKQIKSLQKEKEILFIEKEQLVTKLESKEKEIISIYKTNDEIPLKDKDLEEKD